ncbi:hypothetical protein [Chryseobacterium bernardetii]|uniref:hypothetical protein n=1 Tax=Chryseobacterium bernardetii TaxID=1241978 RepID=UPI0030161CF8
METKTFNQSFKEVINTFSLENIYVSSLRFEITKKNKTLLILSSIIISVGLLLFFFDDYSQIGYCIQLIVVIPWLIYFVPIRNKMINEMLALNNYPSIENSLIRFFKWKTPELEDMRLLHVFDRYKNYNIETLEKLVEIARHELSKEPRNIFSFFEKSFEYFGKNYIGLIIGIFIAEANRENSLNKGFSVDNFHLILKIALILMSTLFSLGFMWEFLIKKAYNQKHETKKEQLQEYIYIIENIILLKQASNN